MDPADLEFVRYILTRYDKQQPSEELLKITKLLTQIQSNQGDFMATIEQLTAALGRVEAATTEGATAVTAIGARISSLEEAIKNMGLSAEQEATLLAQLEGVAGGTESLAAALTAMGKTPEQPVPVPVPQPLPEPVDGGEGGGSTSAVGRSRARK